MKQDCGERTEKKKRRVEDLRLLLSSSSVISKPWNQDGWPDWFYDSSAEALVITRAIIPSTGALGLLEPCTPFQLLSEEGAIWQAHRFCSEFSLASVADAIVIMHSRMKFMIHT